MARGLMCCAEGRFLRSWRASLELLVTLPGSRWESACCCLLQLCLHKHRTSETPCLNDTAAWLGVESVANPTLEKASGSLTLS